MRCGIQEMDETVIQRIPAWPKAETQMKTKQASRKVNRRKAILQAAEKLMLSRGLSGITTRQISEEAGCSEGALYVHFNGRLELLLAMLEESLPEMLRRFARCNSRSVAALPRQT